MIINSITIGVYTGTRPFDAVSDAIVVAISIQIVRQTIVIRVCNTWPRTGFNCIRYSITIGIEIKEVWNTITI